MPIVPLVCIRPLFCECLSTYCESPTTHIRFADFHACTTPMTSISACFRSPVYPYIRTDPPNVYIRLPLRISVYTRPPFYPFRCPAPAITAPFSNTTAEQDHMEAPQTSSTIARIAGWCPLEKPSNPMASQLRNARIPTLNLQIGSRTAWPHLSSRLSSNLKRSSFKGASRRAAQPSAGMTKGC